MGSWRTRGTGFEVGLEKLPSRVRVTDGGLLVAAEDEREVEGIGAVGEASSSCRSTRSRTRVRSDPSVFQPRRVTGRGPIFEWSPHLRRPTPSPATLRHLALETGPRRRVPPTRCPARRLTGIGRLSAARR